MSLCSIIDVGSVFVGRSRKAAQQTTKHLLKTIKQLSMDDTEQGYIIGCFLKKGEARISTYISWSPADTANGKHYPQQFPRSSRDWKFKRLFTACIFNFA